MLAPPVKGWVFKPSGVRYGSVGVTFPNLHLSWRKAAVWTPLCVLAARTVVRKLIDGSSSKVTSVGGLVRGWRLQAVVSKRKHVAFCIACYLTDRVFPCPVRALWVHRRPVTSSEVLICHAVICADVYIRNIIVLVHELMNYPTFQRRLKAPRVWKTFDRDCRMASSLKTGPIHQVSVIGGPPQLLKLARVSHVEKLRDFVYPLLHVCLPGHFQAVFGLHSSVQVVKRSELRGNIDANVGKLVSTQSCEVGCGVKECVALD